MSEDSGYNVTFRKYLLCTTLPPNQSHISDSMKNKSNETLAKISDF